MNIGDRVKFITMGGWYNSGIIKDMDEDEDSYLIEVDELGCKPPKDVHIQLPYYARVLSCEIAESNAKDLAERMYEQIAEEADYINIDRKWYFEKVVHYMRSESEDKE